MRPLSVIPLLTICFLLLASPLCAQSGPPQEKLVFENQFVKVYDVTLHPGEKLPVHPGGNRIVYSLNDYKLLYHWDGKTTEENRKVGEVHYHPEGMHAEENGPKSPARFLIVERESAPLPAPNGTGLDMARANPNNTRVLFDRDMAKVYEVTLQPKDAASMCYCPDRLVYAVEPGQLVVVGPDGAKTKLSLKKGGAQWCPSGLHTLENSGPNKTKLVVFAFKK